MVKTTGRILEWMSKYNSKDRFSSRVENYVKYRPHYPKEIVSFLRDKIKLGEHEIIADIGSGTGISSLLFLENSNVVYGVEPNLDMREAAEEYLVDYPNFKSVDGTAENSGLNTDSVDLVISGQAFHWFDQNKSKIEFRKILNDERSSKNLPNTILLWNSRQLHSTPFLREYEKLLLDIAKDYEGIYHENRSESRIRNLYHPNGFEVMTFDNNLIYDFTQLKGRVLSSSYSPNPNDSRYDEFLEKITEIFNKYERDETIEFRYITKVYYGII